MNIKCNVCGCEFPPVVNNHYVARDNGKVGVFTVLQSNDEGNIYDAFDCPFCGCQVIAHERKRVFIAFDENSDEDEEEDEDNEQGK